MTRTKCDIRSYVGAPSQHTGLGLYTQPRNESVTREDYRPFLRVVSSWIPFVPL